MIKKLLLPTLCLLIINTTTYSQGNWDLLIPSPTSNQMVSLCFSDSLTGWSVGKYGTITKTNDGGLTWQIIESDYLADFSDVCFPTKSVGYIVGESGLILKTSDGGDIWNKQDISFSNNLNRVKFRNEQMGWVIAEKGLILYTSNGGETWTQQASGGGEQLNSIEVLNGQGAVIVGENNTLLLTEDNGSGWQLIEPDYDDGGFNIIYNYKDIYFANDTCGWVSGQAADITHGIYNGFIAVTQNGGKEWSLSEIYEINFNDSFFSGGIEDAFQQIYFKDDLMTGVCLIGVQELYASNSLLQTTDGGKRWKGFIDGRSENTKRKGRFQFLTDSRVIATGYQGDIRFSDDSGLNWYFNNNQARFWDGFQIGPDNVLHVVRKKTGSSGEFDFKHLISEDKGATWNETNSTIHYLDGSEEEINSAPYYAPDNLGWFTLTSGSRLFTFFRRGEITDTTSSILYSDDMGITYHELRNGVNIPIGDSRFWNFLTPDTLIYTNITYDGQRLTCKISYDGGETIISNSFDDVWNSLTSSYWNPANINDSYFFNSKTGFLVGRDGNILKTEDTGQSWENIYSGIVEDLWAIEFLNEQTGFVVGNFGRILKTEDGGDTWRKTNSGTQEDIFSIAFLNETEGWVGTESGMRYTTDGGETWHGVPLRYQHGAVRHIAFDNDGTGYAYTLCSDINGNRDFEIEFSGSYVMLQRMTDNSTDINDHKKINKQYPEQIILYPNYPNPFNATTRIKYSLPKSGVVSLKIFNVRGQLVRTLVNRSQKSGYYSTTWDGYSDFGIPVSSGVYIYQLRCNSQIKSHKLLLIK